MNGGNGVNRGGYLSFCCFFHFSFLLCFHPELKAQMTREPQLRRRIKLEEGSKHELVRKQPSYTVVDSIQHVNGTNKTNQSVKSKCFQGKFGWVKSKMEKQKKRQFTVASAETRTRSSSNSHGRNGKLEFSVPHVLDSTPM